MAASDLCAAQQLAKRRLRPRLLVAAGVLVVVVAVVVLLPGLGGLRARRSHAAPGWLRLGAALKVLAGVGYVMAFRIVFCRRMRWRVTYEVRMSELAANALFPTGGAGGLALGASARRRGGMAAQIRTAHPGADASRLRRRYGAVVATNEKPAVQVPTDQPPSYQLELEDVIVGSGDEAVSGRVVEVHYVGVSWSTGEQFDASWDRRDTFKFKLGKGQVIAGWDQGVSGMKVGGRRRITIPPMLAYGKRGAGGVIGPDETLVFVIDLIAVN